MYYINFIRIFVNLKNSMFIRFRLESRILARKSTSFNQSHTNWRLIFYLFPINCPPRIMPLMHRTHSGCVLGFNYVHENEKSRASTYNRYTIVFLVHAWNRSRPIALSHVETRKLRTPPLVWLTIKSRKPYASPLAAVLLGGEQCIKQCIMTTW